jgi:hypothetical protein
LVKEKLGQGGGSKNMANLALEMLNLGKDLTATNLRRDGA